MYRDQFGEFVCGYWGLKSLLVIFPFILCHAKLTTLWLRRRRGSCKEVAVVTTDFYHLIFFRITQSILAVLIVVQVKDYAKKLVTAMIWFTSRMKLDPKKERWVLSVVVKSFVLLDKNKVFLACGHYIKPFQVLSIQFVNYKLSIFQPAQLAFLWCEFCFWFVFIWPREVKTVNDRGRWRGGKREFFSLPSSPSFSRTTSCLAFAQLYLLLYEPQKKKHQHQKTTRVAVGKVRLDKSLPSG